MPIFNAAHSFKQIVTQMGVMGVVAIGSLALAQPAQAASLNLSTWNAFGDVLSTSAQAQITNAANIGDGGDNDAINQNLSGNSALLIDALENNLPLGLGTIDADEATEGSAIQTTLIGVMAGDKFSFNWSFKTFDTRFIDRAFVTINDTLFNLTGPNPLFSYTFTGAGNYRIAIGVVDVVDVTNSSILTVNNANFTAVPTPALLPGLIALGLRSGLKRRQTSN